MSDRPGVPRVRLVRKDAFERRLFELIDEEDLHFPKGIVVSPDDAHHARGLTRRLGDQALRWTRSLKGLLWSPAFAYAWVLLLVLPAYVGLARRPDQGPPPGAPAPLVAAAVKAPVATTGAARVVALGSGPTRSATRHPPVVVSSAEPFLVLTFLVPIRTGPSNVYQAVIRDAAGHALAVESPLKSADDLGNFVLVCRSELFGEGDHVLTVSRVQRDAAEAKEEYLFPFRVTRSAR